MSCFFREIDPHFIEEETGLVEDMKAIQKRKQTLMDRLSFTSSKKAKVAAIAATAVLCGMVRQG